MYSMITFNIAIILGTIWMGTRADVYLGKESSEKLEKLEKLLQMGCNHLASSGKLGLS